MGCLVVDNVSISLYVKLCEIVFLSCKVVPFPDMLVQLAHYGRLTRCIIFMWMGGGEESESEWKGNGESVFTYTVNHDLLVDG